MEYLLLAGLGTIILVAVFAWLARQKTGAGGKTFTGNVESSGQVKHAIAPPMTNAAQAAAPTQADLENEVRVHLAYGRKEQAVDLVRERTSMSLREAKDLVDAVESGFPPSTSIASLDFGNAQSGAGADVDAEARRLVAARRMIDAIKLVRERTGLGLKEAKDYVERL